EEGPAVLRPQAARAGYLRGLRAVEAGGVMAFVGQTPWSARDALVPLYGDSNRPTRGSAADLGVCPTKHSQYFGTLGWTLSLQARMPPTTLRTCLKPFCRKMPQAFALRIPLLQWITMSASGSNSPRCFGNSPSGMSFDPGMLAILYSCGSRTSIRTKLSP